MRYKDALELTGARNRDLALMEHSRRCKESMEKMPPKTIEESLAQYHRLKAESAQRKKSSS